MDFTTTFTAATTISTAATTIASAWYFTVSEWGHEPRRAVLQRGRGRVQSLQVVCALLRLPRPCRDTALVLALRGLHRQRLPDAVCRVRQLPLDAGGLHEYDALGRPSPQLDHGLDDVLVAAVPAGPCLPRLDHDRRSDGGHHAHEPEDDRPRRGGRRLSRWHRIAARLLLEHSGHDELGAGVCPCP